MKHFLCCTRAFTFSIHSSLSLSLSLVNENIISLLRLPTGVSRSKYTYLCMLISLSLSLLLCRVELIEKSWKSYHKRKNYVQQWRRDVLRLMECESANKNVFHVFFWLSYYWINTSAYFLSFYIPLPFLSDT